MQSNETRPVPAAAAQPSAPAGPPSNEDIFTMALSLRDDARSFMRELEDRRSHTRKLLAAVPWKDSPHAKAALWILEDLEMHDCRWRWMAKKVRGDTVETPRSLAQLPAPKRQRLDGEKGLEDIVPFVGIVLSAALAHGDFAHHKQSLQLHKLYEASDALCKAMQKAGTNLGGSHPTG